MAYALTSKSQVTIPKQVRQALHIGPGEEIDYVIEADGRVMIVPSRPSPSGADNPFLKWRGTGILKMSTEDILRETRGDDCMR